MAVVKVHHLNCGSFLGGLVTHCLLVEADDCLVLVDSGYGVDCVRKPWRMLGPYRFGPSLVEAECAVRQVEALGHDPRDVRHILLTHMDFDHTGGLPDFPWATVHVHGPEYRAAMSPAGFTEKQRYRGTVLAHGPSWATHEAEGGSEWLGFEAVRDLPGLPSDILIVPLLGHTRGHAGIAVDTGDGWLLHAGDSHLLACETDPHHSRSTPATRFYDSMFSEDRASRAANVHRLRQLRTDHGDKVTVFSSHDGPTYRRITAAGINTGGPALP